MSTAVAYKLFRTKKTEPNKLYPLFVNADKEIPMNTWINAECGEMTKNGKVKSKLGELHYRCGWHCNDKMPYVTHIGIKGESGAIEYHNPQYVWCEVEYHTDVDYQNEANDNGRNKKGIVIPKNAELTHIPTNGFYKYKTNPNMFGEWVICGEIKVNRVLDYDEVIEICGKYGMTPLPIYEG